MCPSCGHSGFLTYDRHEHTQAFRRESVVCVACEALEAAAKQEKADEVWPGTKTYMRNTMGETLDAAGGSE